MKKNKPKLQQYPREADDLISSKELFKISDPPMKEDVIDNAIDKAFERCKIKKNGKSRIEEISPEDLVDRCIKHLKTRSDPILSPYFVTQCKVEDIFELDAVSHEMQRHRMTIGVFYQYLLLELMRNRWNVFDGTREGDIVADIDTPSFQPGVRLYMSVKKSKDTVGGQDIGGVIRRLENLAKEEKNLTRPYLCVVCVATPHNGKLSNYEKDRSVKYTNQNMPYSLNCEYWGPAFIFPFVTGHNPKFIYLKGIKRVSAHLPFLTLKYKDECSKLLIKRLDHLGLMNKDNKIDQNKFLEFSCEDNK